MSDTMTQLNSALATPDDDVEVPAPVRPTSFAAQIAALRVGETASRAERLSPSLPLDFTLEQLPEQKEALRNAVSTSMRVAKQRTGGEYTIEMNQLLTSKNFFILALVTRTA